MSVEKKVSKSKSYGNKLGYSIFQFTLKHLGLNFGYAILLLIIPYYLIFRPGVYFRSKPYLMKRFPGDNFFKRYLRLFKYIFVFGRTLLDQFYFGVVGEEKIKLEFEREPEILELLAKRPVIFLMSHLGYWEVAMAGSARFHKIMNVLVNQDFDKNKRQSFYDIQQGKMNFINVSDVFGGMIEATNALMRGEVVGVTGDRSEQWRSKSVPFFGTPAKFPIIAEQLAIATGASIIVILTSKVSRYHVRFHWKDISTEVLSRTELSKDEKIQKMLELYSEELENHLQKNPYLWFNFFDFWNC